MLQQPRSKTLTQPVPKKERKRSTDSKDGNAHRIARRNNTPINAIPNPILEIIANFFYSKVAGNFTF